MRKSYTRAERDELIRAVRRGEPVAAAAARLGVVVATAYHWVGAKGRERQAARPVFAQLVPAGSGEAPLVVRVGVAEIAVRRGFDSELLRAVVAALGGGDA